MLGCPGQLVAPMDGSSGIRYDLRAADNPTRTIRTIAAVCILFAEFAERPPHYLQLEAMNIMNRLEVHVE